MTRSSIANWIGLVARLYALCLVAFYASSVAIIVAIKAETFLTRDVLWDVFVLDTAISAPIALVCSLIPVYFAHGAEG